MTIDEMLKSIRKEMNISQESLARELNVSFAAINRWENNRVKPGRMALALIKEFGKKNPLSKELKAEIEKIRIL